MTDHPPTDYAVDIHVDGGETPPRLFVTLANGERYELHTSAAEKLFALAHAEEWGELGRVARVEGIRVVPPPVIPSVTHREIFDDE